ncbi:PAS domain S-box protein [Synechococcus sp. GreenBA-s]|nr:PAS domain S-box protein [Synechococcus sp. GreenBA-s]
MQHTQRANPRAPGSDTGTTAARARPFSNPLLPLAAAGSFAIGSLGLNWQQNQATLSLARILIRSQATVTALVAVEAEVLRGTLQASLLRQGRSSTASSLGFSTALTDRPLAELEQLSADNPTERIQVARLRSQLAAHRRSRTGFSDRPMQATLAPLLAQLRQMNGAERQQLAQRTVTLERLQRRLRLLEATSGLAILVLLGIAAWLLLREREVIAATQGALVLSEERFHYLFENTSVGIAITRLGPGGAGPALQVNGALADLLGTSRADLEEQGLPAFLQAEGPPAKGPQPEAEARTALLEGTLPALRQTRAYRQASGDTVWVDETSFVRTEASTQTKELFSLLVNITQLKSEEHSLLEKVAYTRSLIETSLDPMATISTQGKIEDVNEATVQATGLPRTLLVGRDFAEFFTEPERAKASYQKVFTEGVVRDYPLTLRHLSGTLMPVLYNASTYRDVRGQVIGVFAAARDVTQIRRMEEQLRSLNAGLEQKVQDRTTELSLANQELESFAYSISHDLRAPLRAIDGFSLKLVRGYGDQLDQEGRRLLQVVRDNALRMGQLIDDLLRFSRLGRRALECTPVEMEVLARGVAADLLDLEGDRRIDVSWGALPPAQGDPALLREVWLNLLANAIKFTRQRPVAHITVGGAVEGDEVRYWVQDDGAGFDMAYADKLFGVFQRLHRQDEFEGSGVGLALVQRILHRHGGHIEGEGHPDRGATFRFSLPLTVPPESAAPPP